MKNRAMARNAAPRLPSARLPLAGEDPLRRELHRPAQLVHPRRIDAGLLEAHLPHRRGGVDPQHLLGEDVRDAAGVVLDRLVLEHPGGDPDPGVDLLGHHPPVEVRLLGGAVRGERLGRGREARQLFLVLALPHPLRLVWLSAVAPPAWSSSSPPGRRPPCRSRPPPRSSGWSWSSRSAARGRSRPPPRTAAGSAW